MKSNKTALKGMELIIVGEEKIMAKICFDSHRLVLGLKCLIRLIGSTQLLNSLKPFKTLNNDLITIKVENMCLT